MCNVRTWPLLVCKCADVGPLPALLAGACVHSAAHLAHVGHERDRGRAVEAACVLNSSLRASGVLAWTHMDPHSCMHSPKGCRHPHTACS